MPFTSSTELLAWLGQNLFLNPQQVNDLRVWTATEPSTHAFCKELLRRDWLTPFQVNQLLKHDGETLVIGANRLHSKLGEGAMGQVFRAWNVRLGRMVAVKTLHADRALSPKAMDRFRREMQTAAALDHPNIVLLRDADESSRVPYLVMDYFEGIDLAEKMRDEGPQPIAQAAEYIRQAALGLQHAFERGIVHRDIKPSNVLLVKTSDGAAVVKLLDFGLARFEREEEGQMPITQAGRLIGTVDFIAPEQAVDAHTADIRADIYSLGCTLFYLLTDKAPFPGNDHLEKLTSRIMGSPPRLRDYRPDAPAALENVLLKMMAREPANRYQIPLEVVAALTPYCREAPLAMPFPNTAHPLLAMPIRSPAESAVGADEPEFQFGSAAVANGSSRGQTLPRETPRKRPSAEATSRSRKPLLYGVIGTAIFLSLVTTAYLVLRPKAAATIDGPSGTMVVTLDSPPSKVWAWNDRKPIIVKVARKDFTGPVTLSVENYPEWMNCSPVTLAAAQNEAELRVLIRFHAQQGPFTMKIVATANGSQQAFVEYPMEIVQSRTPAGKVEPSQPKDDDKEK